MSRSRRRFLVELGGSLLLPIARPLVASETDRAPWQTDFTRARQICAAENRPLLLFVTMDGCPYCEKMMASTYTDAGVAVEAAETFVLTVVNSSKQSDLVKRLGVRIYPTTYLIDPGNRLVDRIEGFVPPDQLRRRLAVASRHLAARPNARAPKR